MPTPNKTYAQQVQDLKNEKIQLEGQLEAADEKLGELAELQRENDNLREQVANYSDDSRRSTVGDNAKLVDAQQVAEQSANQVKVLSQQLKAEQQANAQLQQLVAELDNAPDIANYQSRIDSLTKLVQSAQNEVLNTQRRAQDAINQVNGQLENQSNELRGLRMNVAAQARLINEFRSIIVNAPDVIGELKQAAGLNNQ